MKKFLIDEPLVLR